MNHNMPNSKKTISIVSPCLNEEDNIEKFYRTISDIFLIDLKNYDLELIFVDNDSSDSSQEKIRAVAQLDNRVKAVFNARNYGVFKSTFNALRFATGDATVLLLPVDFQDPPELLPQFVERWEQGFDIVAGVRKHRDESAILRGSRRLFYYLVSQTANIRIPQNVGEYQLIDRRVLKYLRQFRDYDPYIRGLVADVGFRRSYVEYTWTKRTAGKSKFNIFGLLDTAVNGLISFSKFPVRMATILGAIMASVSLAYSVTILILGLYAGQLSTPGITTLLVALFFFGGVQLLFLGLIGEYVAAIHFQVRRGNIVAVRETINIDETYDADV